MVLDWGNHKFSSTNTPDQQEKRAGEAEQVCVDLVLHGKVQQFIAVHMVAPAKRYKESVHHRILFK